MAKRRVVITGLGVVTPLGEELELVWNRILEGHSGIKPLTRIANINNYPVRFGGEITPAEFDPTKLLEHKVIKRVDPFSCYGLCAGIHAVHDSGIDFTRENCHRAGVIVGSGIGGISTMEEEYDVLNAKGVRRVSPFTVPKLMVNAAAGNLSIQWGLKGRVVNLTGHGLRHRGQCHHRCLQNHSI